jgi:hypothetical protein
MILFPSFPILTSSRPKSDIFSLVRRIEGRLEAKTVEMRDDDKKLPIGLSSAKSQGTQGITVPNQLKSDEAETSA